MSKSKYKVLLSMGAPDGKTYRKGDLIELSDKDARFYNKHKAIGLYLGEDEEAPDELPKPKKRAPRPKPAAPAALSDSDLITPDPKVR